jgi:hypothetical protein
MAASFTIHRNTKKIVVAKRSRKTITAVFVVKGIFIPAPKSVVEKTAI